ncbi:MAG: hypothetical protein M1820_007070 [Bogoriella megaspora]|nr:MAG: hypothetical protein M1820_007070 [Bogoriella megaspora]
MGKTEDYVSELHTEKAASISSNSESVPRFYGQDEDSIVEQGNSNNILEPVRSIQRSVKEVKEDVQNSVGVSGGILGRSITGRSAVSSVRDPGQPPDGGVLAWTICIGGHLVIACTWGYIASFGVFQTYYATLGHPPSDISWVGSVQIFLLFFIGAFSGRALDAGYFHHIFVTGVIFQLIGVFMTSLATKYWQLFLAQGVCNGIANGLQFCPTLSLVSTYFSKHRAFALGFVATGSATGGLLFPGLVRSLLPRIGFPWTIRVLGFIMMGFSAISIAVLRTRLPPRKSGPIIEISAFREPAYSFYVFAIFFCFWSLYFAFYYVGAFGRDIIGVTYEESIDLLLIMNGIGIPGRLLPNFFADRTFGPLNMITPFAFGTGILFYGWAGVRSRAAVYSISCYISFIDDRRIQNGNEIRDGFYCCQLRMFDWSASSVSS